MFTTDFPTSKRWQWWALLLFIGLFAFAVRYYYALHAQVQQPRGDAVEYVAYARNLAQHGVFTMAPPGTTPLVGDSFRDPGYPAFLAGWMKLFGQYDSWYAAMLLSQALLSALTVMLMVAVARRWMPLGWLLTAGMLMAVWPHSVTMSGYLLSETLFGFLAALGLLLLRVALEQKRTGWAAASGIGFSLAALTNAVLIPFAPLLALYLFVRKKTSTALCASLAIAALAVLTPWTLRNSLLPAVGGHSSSSGRALINLVQGSWPDMFSAYQARANDDPDANALMAPIQREVDLVQADPLAGLAHMGQRMASHPGTYIRWYLGKPVLLWGWSIRVGQGDIYVFPTRNSPFETTTPYRIVAAICRALNPWLFVLAIAGGLLALLPKQQALPSLAATALMLIFVTLVYSILQAEPRYSVPFRSQEIALAMFAACRLSQVVASIGKQARARSSVA